MAAAGKRAQKIPPLLQFLFVGTLICMISLTFGSNLNSYLEYSMGVLDKDSWAPPATEDVVTIRRTRANTVILVLSGRTNWERRQTIRSTWATGHDNVYFVVGKECPYRPSARKFELTCELDATKTNEEEDEIYSQELIAQEETLQKEQQQYQDLIVVNRSESYRSLPGKLKESLAWVCENLPAKWIIKADDDFFVRVGSISAYLEKTHRAEEPTLLGHIMRRAPVHRNGKWAEFDYKPARYPLFPLGSHGYAISRPIAEFVAASKESLFEYQGEDTSIGIWLHETTAIKTQWKDSDLFQNNADCFNQGLYVIGHNIAPAKVTSCYHQANEVTEVKQPASLGKTPAEAEVGASEVSAWMPARLTNSSAVVIVMSARKHASKRQVIRETWASGYDNVYFVIAEACPYQGYQLKHEQKCIPKRGRLKITDTMKAENEEEEERLIKEQALHRDMIYAPTKEAYHSLVFKLKFAMDWVVTHVTSANWIVKADDDIFVRIAPVEAYLGQFSPTNPTLIGHIIPSSPVWKQGKWADWYDKMSKYPPWPQGSCGYAVSRPIAEYIKQESDRLVEYQGEDTTLGIWIHEESALSQTTIQESDHFTNDGKCENAKSFVVGHSISAARMSECYKLMKPLDERETKESRMLHVREDAAENDVRPNSKRESESIIPNKEGQLDDLGAPEPTTWIQATITNATMVVLVQSSRANFAERQTIRKTWASAHDNVYFVVSDGCPHPPDHRKDDLSCVSKHSESTLGFLGIDTEMEANDGYNAALAKEQHKLIREQYANRDMIYIEKHESYYGLVRKLKEAYDWVVKNTQADWIVKVDDDTFVRVDSVFRHLHRLSPSNPTVMGRLIRESPVWKSGPWADPDYSRERYPVWPQGSCGHVVSRPVAQWVSDHKESLHEFQGEDTSLGIWIDESPMKTSVVWEHTDLFVNEGNCVDPNFLIVGHDFSPRNIQACYDAGDEVTDYEEKSERIARDEATDYDEQIILEAATALQKGHANMASWPAPRISKAQVVIIVMTSRNNFDKRTTIRKHWGNRHDNVYFVIGEACHVPKNHRSHVLTCEKRGRDHSSFSMMGTTEQQKEDAALYAQSIEKEQQRLLDEQNEFRDLIYTFKQESYRGLVHKLKEAYSWVVQNTQAQWIVKADDDMYVRVDSTSALLKQFRRKNPTVVGHIIWSSPVHKSGKWADMEYSKKTNYPPWPQGSCGHVVNRKVAQYIANYKDQLFEYQGEDTSLAIWLDESNFKGDIIFQDSKAFTNDGNCSNPSSVIIGHALSPQQIRRCFNAGDELK